MSELIIGIPPNVPTLGGTTAIPGGVLVPVVGRDGRGLNLAGVLPTYTALPTDLDESDAGIGYLVLADNLAYLWSGTAWPTQGAGLRLKGDNGDPGRGVEAIMATPAGLRFTMTAAPNLVDVAVPALAAATTAAGEAGAHADDALAAADVALTAADTASDHATTAGNAAVSAASSANTAAGSRDTAASAANAAAASAGAASNSAAAAVNSTTAAVSARDLAQAASGDASNSANAASIARQGAETARDIAAGSAATASTAATAADASASDAQHWAESAAETVGSGIPNAESTIKGGLMLPGAVPGELGGTFEHPVVAGWSTKADTSTVAAKYSKPAGGIPKTDTDAAVQTSLGKADSAYQRPGAGIPKADMDSAVQTSLGRADTAVQVDGTGKVPAGLIPAIALTEFLGTPATQAAMLALTGQRGDWCTRTDTGTDWQLIAEPSSTASNWRERTYPASPVTTVNGRTGAVTTTATDLTDATAIGRAVLTAGSASAARSTIGAGTSSLALGTTAGTAAAGDDARLADQRTPADGTVTNAKVAAGAAIALSKLAAGYIAGADNTGPRTLTFWVGTESQFTAIGTKDNNTVYLRTA